MFGFRRVAYMLLSRHFWVGLSVGFFLAGFLVNVIPAHAGYWVTDCISGTCASATSSQIFNGDGTVTLTAGMLGSDTGNVRFAWFPYIVDYENIELDDITQLSVTYSDVTTTGTCALQLQTYVSSTETRGLVNLSESGSDSYNVPTYAGGSWFGAGHKAPTFGFNESRAEMCTVTLTSLKYDGAEQLFPEPPTGGGTLPLPMVVSEDMLATTTCETVSDITSCSFEYENITMFTPQNLVFLGIIFFCFVFAGYWIVKKLW